jgi:type I site-specific restriction endonuclease
MRVLCRDAEWLVQRIEASNDAGTKQAVHVVGVDDLVRGHLSIFLTQLDQIESVDPRKTKLVPDNSHGFRRAKLFLEAQLRQMSAFGEEPDMEGLGVFDPMKFQMVAVRRSLEQLRSRLLLADAVGLGKTIQIGMILIELMRRGRANRILSFNQEIHADAVSILFRENRVSLTLVINYNDSRNGLHKQLSGSFSY